MSSWGLHNSRWLSVFLYIGAQSESGQKFTQLGILCKEKAFAVNFDPLNYNIYLHLV